MVPEFLGLLFIVERSKETRTLSPLSLSRREGSFATHTSLTFESTGCPKELCQYIPENYMKRNHDETLATFRTQSVSFRGGTAYIYMAIDVTRHS